jgi:flagellar motor switch protein FliM
MAIEEHDSAATTPWRQTPQPDHSGLSIERMPGLVFALGQFALNVTEALASLCAGHSLGTVNEMEPKDLFEFLGDHEGRTAAVLHSAQLDARLLLIFDAHIADTLVNAVFGGEAAAIREAAEPARPSRPLTGIETNLIAELARSLGKALDRAFAEIASLELTFERLQTLIDVYALGRRDTQALAARLTIETRAGPTNLLVLLPQALLLPIRQNLSFDPGRQPSMSDPGWTRQMKVGVTKARVVVTAVLDEVEMTLGEIADLAVGQALALHGAGMGRVRLQCAGREMFWCKLGRGEGRYSLEIEEPIEPESDSLEAATAR